jgi:hypothetical protein
MPGDLLMMNRILPVYVLLNASLPALAVAAPEATAQPTVENAASPEPAPTPSTGAEGATAAENTAADATSDATFSATASSEGGARSGELDPSGGPPQETGDGHANVSLEVPVEEPPASPPRQMERYDGPPTLLDRRVHVGGYLGFTANYTRMFGRNGSVVGLEGGVLVAHRLSVGLAAYGWTNPPRGPNDEFDNARRFEAAYAGGAVHYSFLNSSPVYVSIGTLIGGGAVVLAPDFGRDDNDAEQDVKREDVDRFFVLQPEINAHVNLTRWARIGLNAGYRIATGVRKFDFDNQDVSGLVAGGKLQFGWL